MPQSDNPLGENCGACLCFLAIDDKGNGLCRRNPPQLVLAGLLATPVTGKPQIHYASTGSTGAFPMMTEQGWCGEFRLKDRMQ